jgi:hypothetical protein
MASMEMKDCSSNMLQRGPGLVDRPRRTGKKLTATPQRVTPSPSIISAILLHERLSAVVDFVVT